MPVPSSSPDQPAEFRRDAANPFALAFHTSPALMAIARVADGRILEVNTAFATAAGYTREEVIGRTSLELNIWPRPADRAAFMARLAQENRVRDYEAVFYTKQREPRYVSLNADIFELNGEACMLMTAIDLSERRRREQVQDATYQISRVLLAGGSLDTLFAEVHRIIGGLMPARNFYVALLDPADGFIHFPYFVDEVVPVAPSRKPGNGLTEYVLQTGQPLLATQETLPEVLGRRGTYTPLERPAAVRLAAPLLIDGKAIGVIALQDYHNAEAYGEEEKRLLLFVAEQAAAAVHRRMNEIRRRESEEYFRKSFQTTPALMIIARLSDGHILEANAGFEQASGYSREEAIGRNTFELNLWETRAQSDEFLARLKRDGHVRDFEGIFRNRHGATRYMLLNADLFEMSGTTCMLTVAVDITARREAARVLQAAKEAADEANRAKSHFLASMSHELRTPLNGILGYTQILRRDAALTGRQRDGVGIIHQSAEHLLALINDVLDLAKIEARKLVLNSAEFDLPEFVRAIEGVFLPRAREKNLLLETAFAPDLPPVVVGDAQRLRQVVFNLLSNAVKFTHQGGVVFSVDKSGDRIRFSVSDSGPGIAEEEQPRLFEPFAQIGDQGRHAEGTGLGLNVSRGIVEQMGGRLLVESRAGWGSRFWFEIPLPAAAAGALAHPASAPRRIAGYAGPQRTVLVADDHPANSQLLVDLLAPLGFRVATVADGIEAVARARTLQPDLVLMDLRMPRLDGFAATRSIREALAAHPPKIIGISASAFEPDREACRQAGCAEFLAKPFREEELLAAIERQLGLQWHYADASAPGTTAPFPAAQHPPSPADAETLFELAAKGDVVGVRAFAQQLAARDPRLAPFAQGVTDLAARFKMKAIRQFVSRYREAPAPPS